jgi:Fe-S-cluster-containing dehydrogenase component/DMSO reductase anchor subunit
LTATVLVERSPPAAPRWDRTVDQPRDLLAGLLRQQQDLSAVERFAERRSSTASKKARTYRDLLPATPPKDGEQYAFEVDLDLCSGCKACVTACHNLNGLDDDEAFRDVGFLHGGNSDNSDLTVIQHVTTACHHCLQPACMTACPVNAYEKDPLTGIVRHLDDQCFGCRYCTLACPYDVPKYNCEKGIIRKCDMCSQRLAVGEAPACARACPHEAIRIRTVKCEDVLHDCETNFFLPGAPEPQHTLPTTNYKTARPLPRNLLPADYYSVRPDHAHPALVVMLVLTQLSVGTFTVDYLLQQFGAFADLDVRISRAYQNWGALVVAILALAASTLHLGRPQYAYRAVLGLMHSWLSREIVCFGLFALLAAFYSVWFWLSASPSASLQRVVGSGVVLAGLAGVCCSVMIYRSTRRPCWTGVPTAAKFLLTTAILGLAGSMLVSLVAAALVAGFAAHDAIRPYAGRMLQALIIAASAKLAFESVPFARLGARNLTPLKRSAMLLVGPLRRWTVARYAFGLIGILSFLALNELCTSAEMAQSGGAGMGLAALAGFVCLLAGELCERHLFFTASVAPRMPGGVAG